MFRWLIALALLVPLGAAERPAAPAREAAELQGRLATLMAQYRVPGMALAIVDREGPVLVTGLGTADMATGRPATERTLFRLGSTSKIFVSLAVLKLVEEGRLSLDAKVRDLLPDLPFVNPWEATEPLRLVHVLEHSAGWDDIPMKAFAHSDPRPAPLAEGLALVQDGLRSRWRPGTRSSYSNIGPSVAAAVVERVTGRRYEDYVEATIFAPLGMDTADFFLSPRSRPLLATLYAKGARKPLPYHHIALRPSGGLNASARDMAALLGFFLRRGEGPRGRLLSEASVQRLETPTSGWGAKAGLRLGYGLGSYTSYLRGSVWHGHGGHVEGAHSELRYLPEQGIAYFFSINAEGQEAFQALDQAIYRHLGPDFTQAGLPAPLPIAAALGGTFSGWYAEDSPRQQLLAPMKRLLGFSRVTVTGDRLRVRPLVGPPLTYVSTGGRLFRREQVGEPLLAALDTPEGRILQFPSDTLRQVGGFQVAACLVGTLLFSVSLLSVLGYAPVWVFRWLRCRRRGRRLGPPGVRGLPLLAVLALAGGALLFGASLDTFFPRFGVRTAWSMGFCACTWAFAAFSLASLGASLRALREPMNRWARLHSLAVSLVFVAAAVYLAMGGWIGLRTWA